MLSESPTAPPHAENRAVKLMREIFESGRPLAYIRTAEEPRVTRILRQAGAAIEPAAPLPVWEWSLTEGLNREGRPCETVAATPRAALDFIVAHDEPAIFQVKDLHEALRDSPEIRRRLRDVYEHCRGRKKFVAVTSPVRAIPPELERSLVYVDLRPPDVPELEGFLREEVLRITGAAAGEATLQQFARALQGLTADEALYALRRALNANPALNPDTLREALKEKQLLVNRSGVIEFITDGAAMGEIGGLPGLKKWLNERRKLFDMRDSLSEEIVPKGVLLMGIPGCGKSLSVKAIASCFDLPLYRVDMTAIFSGRVGKPETAFVEACRMMEDMSPAVLWFDEIERAVTATESGGEQGRIFGFFLTWMQEKTRGLFLAATANRINLLPAEMIRKGRFDEIFFVDLPDEEEQTEIFRIHLLRRGVDIGSLDQFALQQLPQFTVGWTGAEIEQCVVSAVTRAKLEDREVTAHDLLSIAAKTVPLSRTMSEQINTIRGWAFERAVRATPQRI